MGRNTIVKKNCKQVQGSPNNKPDLNKINGSSFFFK